MSRAARCALQSCELAAARVVDPLGPTVANANSASAAKYAAYVSSFLLFSFFLALGFEVVFGICNSPLPFECECTVRVRMCVYVCVYFSYLAYCGNL